MDGRVTSVQTANLRPRLSCAICTKTVAAKNGSATRRLKGNRVVLATLIAGNLKSLAFTASLWPAKVCTTRIPARLAAFRMSQISFLVVFLLAFGERKCVTTFRACDLDIWHVAVSPEVA